MGRRLTATRLAAVGIAGLLALLALLWYQTRDGAAAPTPTQQRDPRAAIAERAAIADVSFQRAVKRSEELRAEIPAGKIDPRSDEFYARFDRAMPRAVSRAAMRNCYHGGLSRQDRDAFITVEFVDTIKNGDVSVSNVRVERSTLTDKALEACMVKEIAATRWHDDALPDWKQEDSVVITPERVVHKYNDDDDDGGAAPADTPRMTSATK